MYAIIHVLQAASDPASAGLKRARKPTLAGGAQIDLEKVAREQQIKNREEMEKILAAVKAKHGEGQLKDGTTLTTSGRDGELSEVTEPDKNGGAVNNKSNAAKNNVPSESKRSKGKAKIKNSRRDGTDIEVDASEHEIQGEAQLRGDDRKNRKHTRSGEADFDKVTGKVDLCLTMHFYRQHCSE